MASPIGLAAPALITGNLANNGFTERILACFTTLKSFIIVVVRRLTSRLDLRSIASNIPIHEFAPNTAAVSSVVLSSR